MGPQYANRLGDLLEDVMNGNQVCLIDFLGSDGLQCCFRAPVFRDGVGWGMHGEARGRGNHLISALCETGALPHMNRKAILAIRCPWIKFFGGVVAGLSGTMTTDEGGTAKHGWAVPCSPVETEGLSDVRVTPRTRSPTPPPILNRPCSSSYGYRSSQRTRP